MGAAGTTIGGEVPAGIDAIGIVGTAAVAAGTGIMGAIPGIANAIEAGRGIATIATTRRPMPIATPFGSSCPPSNEQT